MSIPTLPNTGFVRLGQIVGDRNADPPQPGVIPVGKSSWWAGIKSGRFPKPVKLGPRTTAWRAEDIRAIRNAFAHASKPIEFGTPEVSVVCARLKLIAKVKGEDIEDPRKRYIETTEEISRALLLRHFTEAAKTAEYDDVLSNLIDLR